MAAPFSPATPPSDGAPIGFHHIHHLDPRVPKYRLRDCHEAVPALRNVPALTLALMLAGPLADARASRAQISSGRDIAMIEKSPRKSPEDARRRAEERFAKNKERHDSAREAWNDLEKLRVAAAAKTERLRALRLAKEAADKAASDRAVAKKAPTAAATRRI